MSRLLLCLLLLLFSAANSISRPSLSEFEELFEVVPDVHQPHHDGQVFDQVDAAWLKSDGGLQQQLAIVPDGDNVELEKEEGYEPYSDELDTYVFGSGMPYPMDDDYVEAKKYDTWLRGYVREPNVAPTPWSYSGADSSPDMWASLDTTFQQCDPDIFLYTSSPIDIDTRTVTDQCYGPSFRAETGIEYDGNVLAKMYESYDRGVTVEVMHCEKACAICKPQCSKTASLPATHQHDEVFLDRFLVHTPAEHKLDSETLDMEIQFYHCTRPDMLKDSPCRPSVATSILFKDGGANVENPLWLVKLAGSLTSLTPDPKEVYPNWIFNGVKEKIEPLFEQYYMYYGSMTRPPCYQNIQWMIARQVVAVSSDLLASFKAYQGENARPTFPVGDKRVVGVVKAEDPGHYTYKGPRGVPFWGKYPQYASCGNTENCEDLPQQVHRDQCKKEQQQQSPINIPTDICRAGRVKGCVQEQRRDSLQFNLGQSSAEPVKILVDDCQCTPCNNAFNSYTLTLLVSGGVFLTLERWDYVLEKITFHTPAEHVFDGVQPDMEIQVLLRVYHKRLGIAIPVKKGGPSPQWLQDIALVVGDATGKPQALVPDLFFSTIALSIQPFLQMYYEYEGSTTVPPCSSQRWFVVSPTKGFTISDTDFNAISSRHIGGNNRPVQPGNDRQINLYGTS